jgi:heme/copper-type cytochrome/quinol oxidase subunit 4
LTTTLKYGAAVLPGLVWLSVWLVGVVYKSASEFVAFTLILATLVAAVTSFPVVVVAFVKLSRGNDMRWVTVSLVFSLPVFILAAVALTAAATRADTLASNNALLTDTYTSPLRAQRGAAKRER